MGVRVGEKGRWALAGLAIAALFAGLLWLRGESGVELNAQSLRDAVARLGVWAPLVYVLVVAFRVPLGVPSQLVLLVGGGLFGTLSGTLYGAAGLLVSALVLFTGARWAGQESVAARLPARFQAVFDIASSRAGAAFVAVGTGYPFGPVTLYHIAAGLTRMSLPSFALAATLGSALRSLTYTYFGSSAVSGSLGNILRAAALFSLVLLVPLLFRRPRSWISQALGRSSPPAGGGDAP